MAPSARRNGSPRLSPAARLLSASALSVCSLRRPGEGGKAAFEIGEKVADVLETDVEAHRRATRRPWLGGPDRRAVERDGEALKAAPRGTDAEQREGIEEGMDGGCRRRLEDDA